MGTSRKKRCVVGAISTGRSPSTPAAAPKPWAPDLAIGELGRRVTAADTAQEHDTNIAAVQAVMLPRDVADLGMEDEVTAGSLTVMQSVQVSKLD